MFEGARLISGEAGGVLESSAFLVENDRILRVGRKGELALPRGAVRVDLTGKTVMPAWSSSTRISATSRRTPSAGRKRRTSRASSCGTIFEQLAYYGVGAVLSLGADRRDIAYQARDEWRKTPPPDAARFFTAGQGLAAPNAGPAGELCQAVYTVTTEAEARKDVQELAARKVDGWIKIWHDSRRGKMAPG